MVLMFICSCDEWGGRDTPSPPPFPSPPDDGRMKDILKTGDYYRFKLPRKRLEITFLSRFDQSYEPIPPSKPSGNAVNFRQKNEGAPGSLDGPPGHLGHVLGLDGQRFIEPIYQGPNGRPLESQRFSGQIYAEHR